VKRNPVTLKIFAMIVMTDLGESIAEIFFKKGLLETGINSVNFGNILEFLSRNSSSALVWLGIAVYIVNFFIWITVLSRIDLSIAFPVGSTSYIFIPVFSMIFLGEDVGPERWLGIALIVAGIHFVSKSSHKRDGDR